MELRKAYIECERKITEREIQNEDKKLKNQEITIQQHQQSIQTLKNQLEAKIIQLM